MSASGQLCGCVLVATFLVTLSAAADKQKSKESSPQPALRLPVEALGYLPQGRSVLVDRLSTSSLDFIDDDHLLLTFRSKGLLKRQPDAQPGDEDQSIHAAVLEVPSGKVLKSADWRMHDYGRYLWPLGTGTFLVRQRDSLYLTNQNLELRPYMQSPSHLESVQPSPDGRLLVLQMDQEKHTPDEHRRLVKQATDLDAPQPREDVKIVIIRADSGAVVGSTQAPRPVLLPIIGDGYLEALPAKTEHWRLSYSAFNGEKKVFGDVMSTCAPTARAATASVALLITCMPRTDDHLVQGIDLNGKILWEFWWESNLVWPSYASSRDGSRFAIGTIRSSHGVNALDPVNDDDIRGQRVKVLDPASGVAVLTVDTTPATASGENFALSPNGKKFAILSAQSVDLYDVPAVPVPLTQAKRK